ncbi:TIGR01777 family oxidoreductase [Xanthomonas nasturtii]|uniref:TIGR01777 family protein n=1 Tax=Xanthomonas nasturtii TaxID=1843581 RepID=A0A3E1KIQ2_9XANT|nr:TIGR01777 family oxidoreductase [Xanthomonas nasturtii]MCL1500236.1 TIGR01777 family oxidoreductase [Xanthomonas nasturtii]MCL1503982.1 TIGR01777 family oxidoreductase [Xanthomonas nasturtii]MCL1523853.1 TIGR01777 family oxidoreductase [Xanthomonas nasturtii]MCL1527188.1 TIGR01777 family oxidoreductase [Xanthomonas nasturtii]MCL1531523.1 TIGR01777 family oxidoreductase [Xanthomonas nasturtii]
MQLLITGGTGFIGQALCPALLQAGHKVSVLTRDPRRASRQLPGVTAVDTLDGVRADAVINLAGEPLAAGRWSDARKQRFRASRLGMTRQLHDWIAQQPVAQRPAVLISGSAVGYYGERGDTVLTETDTAGDDFSAVLCRDWEAEANTIAALGPRVSWVRTGIVLDRDGGALARMLPAFRFGGGGPFGDGRHWMSWIHRADMVALLLWLLQHGEPGAYNATAPNPVTNADFARTLAQVLHRPALLALPAGVLRLGFGEMADLLLVSQRVLPQRALAAGFGFQYAHLDAALRAILQR